MSQLSNLTAAARRDLVPDYILSPPRLREHGVAESACERRYIQRIANGIKGLPTDVQIALMKEAIKDVRDGWLTLGMPGYEALIQSARGMSLMFLLCLRVKHPQVTAAEAKALWAAGDEGKLTDAVYALWGYGSATDAEGKKKTKRRARSRGVQSSTPSPPQPNEAGTDSVTPPPPT